MKSLSKFLHKFYHLKDLLGRDLIQVKRDAENTLGFQPLTITGKIKVSNHLKVYYTSLSLNPAADPKEIAVLAETQEKPQERGVGVQQLRMPDDR